MRINPFLMPVIILVALFGTVLTAQALGLWTTNGRATIDPGKMTAADLKGWMTLQEVMEGLQISQSSLYAAGKIPADVPPSTALNKLEALVPGFSVTALRTALTSGPSVSFGGSPTATIKSDLASTPVTPISTRTLAVAGATPSPKASGEGTGSGSTPLPAGQILPADQIKGKMTLREVSVQCAVPIETLIQKLNLPANTSPDTAIKDLIAQSKLTDVTDVQKVVVGLLNK